MRRAAFGLLVATGLGGCNQIFGLKETTALPDSPVEIPIDAAWSSIQVGFWQLAFDPSTTVPAPALVPFPDLTRFEVGTLTGPLVTRMPDTNGSVTIPIDITEAGAFRLVYQRGTDVVHEYQGLVADARVIEPLFGPLQRPAVPGGAGFLISPTNAPTNHTLNRVFTVGTFTDGATVVVGPGGPTLDYAYQAPPGTFSMSGPLGLPGATDLGVLVDFDIMGQCRRAIGSATFPADKAATHPTVMGMWTANDTVARTSTTANAIQLPPDIIPFGEGNLATRQHYGFVPSEIMPAFTRPPDLVHHQVALANPVMMPLRVCTSIDSSLAVHDPLLFKDKFKRALYTETTVDRTLSGATITNGVAVLTLGLTGFQVDSDVAFATAIKLTADGNVESKLFESADSVPVPAFTGATTLSWGITVASQKADFWDVTLWEISGGSLVKRRIYTTTTREVKIQRADLEASKQYVFQVSAYRGRPNASTKADFATVSGNQSMSVVHSRSFVLAP